MNRNQDNPISYFYLFPLLFSITLAITDVNARVHDFETARLKSTAGCGVGSILMDEGTLLNPAPLSFYNISSGHISQHNTKYTETDQIASNPNKSFLPKKQPNYGIILSDSKNNLKGSISFLKQREWDDKRDRVSMSLSSVVGPYSALGFTFRQTKDLNKYYNLYYKEEKYSQVVIGASHSIKPELSFGLIIIDPFKAKREDGRFILGSQLTLYKIVIFMVDLGSDYNDDLAKNLLYRGAMQLNFFSDLYLRLGGFNDKKLCEKGSGIGLGWVTPNFVVDLGIKNTNQNYDIEKKRILGFPPSQMREISFGLGIKF